MDEDMARDLARQFREHLHYQGDAEQFDQEVMALIKHVERHCAQVVKMTPTQLFLTSSPETLLGLIAAAVQGQI